MTPTPAKFIHSTAKELYHNKFICHHIGRYQFAFQNAPIIADRRSEQKPIEPESFLNVDEPNAFRRCDKIHVCTEQAMTNLPCDLFLLRLSSTGMAGFDMGLPPL